jgi:hypothetical protein
VKPTAIVVTFAFQRPHWVGTFREISDPMDASIVSHRFQKILADPAKLTRVDTHIPNLFSNNLDFDVASCSRPDMLPASSL